MLASHFKSKFSIAQTMVYGKGEGEGGLGMNFPLFIAFTSHSHLVMLFLLHNSSQVLPVPNNLGILLLVLSFLAPHKVPSPDHLFPQPPPPPQVTHSHTHIKKNSKFMDVASICHRPKCKLKWQVC